MSTRVVICCGAGGVGKTTISAAMGIRWALAGHRVAVVTIDPALRLADSLSIGEIGNTPRAVPLSTLGLDEVGTLDALMLDAKATFDDLIERYAPNSEAARRVLDNRYYQFASTRLGGAHEYMAAEKLYEMWKADTYDIIVVDTPPTRNALEFLQAPDRMAQLMDGAVMRWMAMPATKSGWRALEMGSEAVARVLKRLVGKSTVGEIAQFFESFRDLWDGFHDRSIHVHDLLRSPDTRFVLITTPAPSARSDALYFLELLAEQKMPFGGFVVNRTVTRPKHRLERSAIPETGPLAPARWAEICDALRQAPDLCRALAQAHERSIDELRAAGPADAGCWIVPNLTEDVHRLDRLASLAPHLPEDVWSG